MHNSRNTESILQMASENDMGYARVSTTDQDARLQHDALTAAGCYRIFTDTASGSLQSRPELDKLMDQLRPGDTLVVWRLDRLGRSIRHLIDQLTALQDRGIEFRSLQENIDTSSPGGRGVKAQIHVRRQASDPRDWWQRTTSQKDRSATICHSAVRSSRCGRCSSAIENPEVEECMIVA